MVCLLFMAALSLIPDLMNTAHNEDKALHTLAYAVMVAGAIAVMPSYRIIFFCMILLFCLGWGIEYFQSIIGGRTASLDDGLANSFGMLIGVISGVLIRSGSRRPSIISRNGRNAEEQSGLQHGSY